MLGWLTETRDGEVPLHPIVDTTRANIPVANWTANTLEQAAIHRRLYGLGVKIVLNTGVTALTAATVLRRSMRILRKMRG